MSDAIARITELENRNAVLAARFDSEQARNHDLQTVCEAIWPYVQHFGLCGAHPQATAAVAKLAELLGHVQPPLPSGAIDKAILAARRAEHEQASIWLRANIDARRHGAILDRFDERAPTG